MGKANCRRTAKGSAKPHFQASQWLATGTRNTGVKWRLGGGLVPEYQMKSVKSPQQ